MSPTHGLVWWSELMTRNVAASRAFYEATCGWIFETVDMPEGEYHLAHAHGRPVAGMMDMAALPEAAETAPHWFTYLAVEDLDLALEAALAQGGQMLRAPFDVPGTGRIALLTDAGGAAVGLMTPEAQWDPPETEAGSLENVPV